MMLRLSSLVVFVLCTGLWGLVSFLVGTALFGATLGRSGVSPLAGILVALVVFIGGFIIAVQREGSPFIAAHDKLVRDEGAHTVRRREREAAFTAFVVASYLPAIAIGAFRTVIFGDEVE